jgi:CBS-domain-containing membrane protein
MGLLGVSTWSIGIAVGLAVTLMLATKTTHPPAGANPILVMLTGQSWPFLFNPVAIGTLFIVLIGVIYHRWICQRAYPVKWF